MKILVVDDEIGLGSMMCRTLRALGHEAILAVHPDDALDMLDASVDAVVSDIDMPGMNGVELARALRARRGDLPVAFCTGSHSRGSTLENAASFGTVVYKPWTVDDVHLLLRSFEAASSASDDDEEAARRTVEMHAPPRHAPAEERRVIHLRVHTWEQVRRLCARQAEGPVFLPLRVSGLTLGQAITVTLRLPDGFAVSIAGEVREVNPSELDSIEQTVELIGLDSNLALRLDALAVAPSGRANEVDTANDANQEMDAWQRALARGSQRMKVSELLLSNTRLRAQIESLAAKMRPRGGSRDKS